MSLRKKSIRGVFWVFTQQFGNQAVHFVVSVFLARILLPEDFGLIGMIAVFMALSQVLLNSGLTQSIIRQTNPTQIDYSTVFFFNLGGGIILYGVLFMCAGLIADFYSQPRLTDIIRVAGLSLIINAFGAVQFTRLTKQMDFKTQMMVTVPSLIVSGIVGVSLALMDFGVWALVYMGLVQAIMSTAQIWIRSNWMPSLHFSKERFRYHFGFSYKLLISGLINTLYGNLYPIVIGKYFAPAQVGFFTRAESMKNLPVSNISRALNKVTYPLFAQIQDDNPRLKRVYKMLMQAVVFVLAPVMVYLMVVAEPLFRLLLTEKWLPAVPYFQILCISGILYPFHVYNLNILNVKGRSDLFLKLEIIKKVLLVITILVSIQFGLYGLLWGVVVSSALALFINAHYSGKFIHYNGFEQLRDVSPILLIAIASGVLTLIADKIMINADTTDIFRIILGGAVGVLSYWLISIIFKIKSI